MEQAILYYSDKCPDTQAFITELEQQGRPYQAINITESMANLRKFLALRDTRREFDDHKRWGYVGIPVLHLPNNRLIFELIDLNGTSCSLTPQD